MSINAQKTPKNDTDTKEDQPTVTLPESVTVKRFAAILGLPVTQVIMELMKNKIMATINDEIDFETAGIIADDLGFLVQKDATTTGEGNLTLKQLLGICQQEKESEKTLQKRAPIVTILGHVDHGKTTLLDTIRKANVATGEAGGITQHISAYQVKKRGELITFIDTPGHAAFSAMRQRGVNLADIVILVVAADDGVRPQTKEVIEYLKTKNIPTIVAITKIDKPEVNIARVKQELAENEILIEEWGGKVMCNEVSAKTRKGLDDLLESVILLAEVEEFRADAKREGLGVVLEAHLDKNKGPVATVLVKTGTLKIGQDIRAGATTGRIRRLEDWSGKSVTEAPPSMPVTVYGLSEVPSANDILHIMQERSRKRSSLEVSLGAKTKVTQSVDENIKKLNIILKADTQGTLEAIEQMLYSYTNEEVTVNYLDSGVGNITESDVKIAETAENALLVGFSVDTTSVASRMAKDSNVNVKTYKVIYELVQDLKTKMEDLLEPEITRTDHGALEVLALFKTGKTDMIVGGKVVEGSLINGCSINVTRGENTIGTGKLINLQQNKVDTNEVATGNECGITFEGETKIKVGDILKCFTEERKKKTLEAK